MTTLAGVGSLVRLIIRRDRVRLLVWILVVVGLMASFAASTSDLYPTPESLQARAGIMDSPLGAAFSGPRIGLDDYTFGALLANEYVGFLAVALAMMSVFLLVRNTRVEEQTGRLDLVRAAMVSRHAPAAAALIVVVAAQLLIGVLLALMLPATGLDLSVGGSWLFSASVVLVGVCFAAVTLAVAQVTSHSRTAVGASASLVAVAYTIRAVGDMADSAFSLLSPIGWAQAVAPFVDNEWWPLPLLVGLFAAATWGALALESRRDVGEGLVPPRPGPRTASAAMGRPLGLSLRLLRGMLLGWGIGMSVLATTYGGFVNEVEEFAGDNPFIEESLSEIGGGTLGESWASFLALFMMALVASFAVQAVLRLRSEETELRAEQVLATPVERWQWLGSQLLATLGGVLVLAVLMGLGFGTSAALATGDSAWVVRTIGATISHIPAVAVVAAFAAMLFGVLPRFTWLAWALIALVWVGLLGIITGLPEWVSNLSPLGHDALVPAADLAITPLLVLAVIAVALFAAAFRGFQRRDVPAE